LRQDDIEYDGKRSGDIVEGNFDPLEAEVVESDHSNKYNTEREDLLTDGSVVFCLGEL
jgi:hypothetical protein